MLYLVFFQSHEISNTLLPLTGNLKCVMFLTCNTYNVGYNTIPQNHVNISNGCDANMSNKCGERSKMNEHMVNIDSM